jgi:hypothetical protein
VELWDLFFEEKIWELWVLLDLLSFFLINLCKVPCQVAKEEFRLHCFVIFEAYFGLMEMDQLFRSIFLLICTVLVNDNNNMYYVRYIS